MASAHHGTTSSSGSRARQSPTSPTRSANAGKTPTRSTSPRPGGCCAIASPTSRPNVAASHRRTVSPAPRGSHAVQVLRTYPARRKPYPFAPEGERSIARAYVKAFANARTLIYLEDQYLWSLDATRALCDALAAEPAVALRDRHPALSRSGRPLPRWREPFWSMARRTRARESRRRSGRDLRPRERREHPDLRAREGVHRRRRVDGRRLRQPQPSLVDPRLRDLLRRDRSRWAPRTRHAPASRSRAPRRRRRRRRCARRPGQVVRHAPEARRGRSIPGTSKASEPSSRPRGHLRRHPRDRISRADATVPPLPPRLDARPRRASAALCVVPVATDTPARSKRALRDLDRGTEAEESTAERDRAQREPRPSEREPAEHVGEPVHVEQDTRARHCQSDRDRAADERGVRTSAACRDPSAARPQPRTPPRSRCDRSETTGRGGARSGSASDGPGRGSP